MKQELERQRHMKQNYIELPLSDQTGMYDYVWKLPFDPQWT